MNPILKDFPDHIETERLLIRSPRPGDGPAYFEAIQESRAELAPWMSWARGSSHQVVAQSEEYVRTAYVNFMLRKELQMAIFLKAGGVFIGGTGLHDIDWEVPSFEIGYWQRTKYTGNGYMTEAVNGLTAFAHDTLGARRMVIRCDTLNLKSRAVAERAGYLLETHVRNESRAENGELRDDYMFAKTWPD